MKIKKILGVFLVLVLLVPTILLAEAPSTSSLQTTGGQAGLPEVKTYDDLRHAISQARAESRLRVEKAVEKERVREAWEIGRLIDTHVLQHKERADYAKRVLERLADDLAMDRSELYRMLEFYRAYPIVVPARQLSWSHYKALIAVNDPEKREVLAEKAEKEGWKRERIREEVRNVTKSGKAAPEEILTAEPGKPGTYRVILAKVGPYAGKLALDLGFSCYYRPAGEFPFKEGEIVAASQDSKGGYSLAPYSVPSTPYGALYTYEAYVYEVLDGDTVNAVVDLGFGFVTTQTLRLRGIDAPEIMTHDGMEAKQALEKMLGMAEGVPSTVTGEELSRDAVPRTPYGTKVLIKTVKSDKYDRYLADVFVDEVYVNQKLLDDGLAVLVEE